MPVSISTLKQEIRHLPRHFRIRTFCIHIISSFDFPAPLAPVKKSQGGTHTPALHCPSLLRTADADASHFAGTLFFFVSLTIKEFGEDPRNSLDETIEQVRIAVPCTVTMAYYYLRTLKEYYNAN